MAKNMEDEEFVYDLLDDFFITSILEPNSKIRVARSAKDIVAEVNRAKRTKRKLNQTVKDFFSFAESGTLINGWAVFIAFIDHLEENIPLTKEVERKLKRTLKLSLDYTKLSKRKRQWIRWQAVAQIIALEDPRKRISTIKREILEDHRLDRLLEFDTLPSLSNPQKKREDRFRKIENAIAEVVKWGVGRPAKDAQSAVVISPLVYSDGRINFQALFTAMSAVGSLLKIWNSPFPKDYAIPVIELYKKTLPASDIIHVFIHIGIWTYYYDRAKGKYYD
ncbi:MAG: hypothetical protein JSR57_10695 [Verrucomicrobia bacterium]|nr:hypothetical protein [Verrucomicrobiota bacterium]